MRPLLVVCFLIMVAGAAAPGVIVRYLGHPADEPSPSERAIANDGKLQARRGSVQRSAVPSRFEVTAQRDGHFYVDALVNRQRVRLMVDTGASVVALRQSDADAAGIRVRRADYDHPVATANGEVNGAEAELDSVAVREIEVNGVRALVLPDESLSVSLLGATFLNRLARFEVSGGTLLFEN